MPKMPSKIIIVEKETSKLVDFTNSSKKFLNFDSKISFSIMIYEKEKGNVEIRKI